MKTDLKKAIEKAEKLKKKGDYNKAINLLLKTRKNISSELMKLPAGELMFQVTKYDKPREKLEKELRRKIKELNCKLNMVKNMKLHIYSMLTDEEIKELVGTIIYEKEIKL